MMPVRKLSVLASHDDPLLQAGLVVAFANCADIALAVCRAPAWNCLPSGSDTAGVDVVVTSFNVGIEMTSARSGVAAAPKVVIVGATDREWELRHALTCGVRGYVLAGCSLEEIVLAARTVQRGARYISPQAMLRLTAALDGEHFSAREEGVLRLVAEGLCNKAIGKRLGVAPTTVKSHLRTAFSKLGVDTRTQAIAAIERRGLFRKNAVEHAPQA